MSVRVALLQRSARGGLLHSLRLVGATSDEVWQPSGIKADREQGETHYKSAAEWTRTQLDGARTRDSLELLVLDPTGGVCTWHSSHSTDPAKIAAEARMGHATDDADTSSNSGPNFVEFYAGSPQESSVQALGMDGNGSPTPVKHAKTNKKLGQVDAPARRLAVLATTDVPARVLIDTLDQQGVRVASVASFWHALAMAWSPGAGAGAKRSTSSDPLVQSPAAAGTCAVLIVENNGRLSWCWCEQEKMLCSGSMRCTLVRAQPSPTNQTARDAKSDEDETLVALGKDDVARLAAEWLSWSVQTHSSPTRVVCVLPKNLAQSMDTDAGPAVASALSAGEFGEALSRVWTGAVVDAVVHEDPMGATLRRLVSFLEATPASAAPESRSSLVALSNRPGRQHRTMYLWTAGALLLASAAAAVVGWRFHKEAAAAREAELGWRNGWQELVGGLYPPAMSPRVAAGFTPLMELSDEVKRRKTLIRGPEKVERNKPVLAELEAISLVLGSPTVKLESIFMDSTQGPQRVVATVPTTSEGEAVLEALRRVGGSMLVDWSLDISQSPGSEERRATYTAKWPAKTTSPAQPATPTGTAPAGTGGTR